MLSCMGTVKMTPFTFGILRNPKGFSGNSTSNCTQAKKKGLHICLLSCLFFTYRKIYGVRQMRILMNNINLKVLE